MKSETVSFVFSGIFILFAILLTYQARKQLRLANLGELATEIKPSEAHLYSGKLVRVAGEAIPVGAEALAAPISQKACVYWKYEIFERVREHDRFHTHRHGHRHSSSQTRTRKIAAGESKQPFMLRDATGHILVDPQGIQFSDIEPSAVRATLTPSHHHFTGFVNPRTFANEWLIPPRATVYAVGTVIQHEDGSIYLLPGNSIAAITMLPFGQFIRKKRLWGFVMVGGAIACILGAVYLLT